MATEQIQSTSQIERLKAWLDLGVSPSLTDSERRRQYIVNATPAIVASAVLLYSLIFWAAGSMALVWTTVYELPIVLAGIAWFRWCQHQNRPASYWEACVVCQLTVLTGIITGQGTLINTHFYFLSFSLTAPLIIPISDKKGLSIVCLECMVMYLALEYFQWPAAPEVEQLPAQVLKTLELAITVSCCSILFVAFFISETFSDELESRLRKFASSDALTGLANRRTFQNSIARAMSHARRTESGLCVAFVDVDFFKKVNDTYGHDAGDEMLKQLAFVLVDSARGSDLVARYGGEEFVILMPDCDVDGAKAASERIRVRVEESEVQTPFFNLRATVSIGIAAFQPYMDERTFLEAADKALYFAKNQGRNRVMIFQK